MSAEHQQIRGGDQESVYAMYLLSMRLEQLAATASTFVSPKLFVPLSCRPRLLASLAVHACA